MDAGNSFSDSSLARLRSVACEEPRLAAIYLVGDLHRAGGSDLAALFTESLPWSDRLDLELAVADALGVDRIELIDLRRMALVFRFGVVRQGDLIYVGQPADLAKFIEETITRYSAFYPLLEALYWKVEASPLPEDRL
jgi:hypothetical protein